MSVNKEHYAKTLKELTTKSSALAKDFGAIAENGLKLDNYLKFTKELNQSINQDCVKMLAFN